MKKLLLFLFVAVSFAACKKSNPVDPTPKSLADRFAGTYQLSSFRYANESGKIDLPTLPATKNGVTVAGTIQLVKKSDTVLNLTFVLKTTGEEDQSVTFEDLEVRQVGTEYGLFADGTRIADVGESVVIFNYSEEEIEMAFVAKR